MVEPEHSTRAEDPVDVEQYKFQHRDRYPVAENVHRMNEVQRAVKEGQALRNCDKHGHHTPGGYEIVEGPVKIHGSGHYRHISLAHSHREACCPSADVQADANGAFLHPQHFVYGEVQIVAGSIQPSVLLTELQIEAIFAVHNEILSILAIYETAITLAVVWSPQNAGVWRCSPHALWEWVWLLVAFRDGFSTTPQISFMEL